MRLTRHLPLRTCHWPLAGGDDDMSSVHACRHVSIKTDTHRLNVSGIRRRRQGRGRRQHSGCHKVRVWKKKAGSECVTELDVGEENRNKNQKNKEERKLKRLRVDE